MKFDENQCLVRKLLDPVSFLEYFVKVETPEGFVKWNMDSYQKHLVRDKNRGRVINKSKKTGISTTLAGESIHDAYVNPGLQIILIATGMRVASELQGKIYDEFDTIPVSLRPKLVKRSTEHCQFPNRARIYSLPSGDPGKIRGFGMRGTKTKSVVDEYAHVANDRELWVVVRDFQRIGGTITLNSTPKGKRGKYYEIAEPLQAMLHATKSPPDGEWSYHEIHFTECPRLAYQEKSLRSDMTEIDFQQEYCGSFIDESISFFPYELIWKNQLVNKFAEMGPKGYVTKNIVLMGIDIGKTVSETVIYIVEEIEPEKFKTLWIEILPGVDYPDQVEVIKQLNALFHPDLINVDATGPGGQAVQDYLLREESLASKVRGYNLSSNFKGKIIIRTRILMERVRFLIPSKECKYGEKVESQFHSIRRTTTVTGEHTRYSGKESGMDDIVWAAALALYKEFDLDSEPYFYQEKDEFLQKMAKEESKINPWIVVKEWEI